METRLMRARLFTGLVAAIALLTGGSALADGRCDLNDLVGYQIVAAKPIGSFIQDGTRTRGYQGCQPDRVLVFTDNSGVRCKQLVRQRVDGIPTGYLFARENLGDMRLCVDGELMEVSQTN